MSDIYVVVAENGPDPDGPIVFETYVNKSSKEEAEAFIKRLVDNRTNYGKCRIAKLTFEVRSDE